MIVIDTSVFIDALFEYDTKRTELAKKLFWLVQDRGITIAEPDIFKVELIGQLVRRMPREEAMRLYELIVEKIETVDTCKLREISFEIALKTGCRAIDSLYISVAHSRRGILISSDRFQVESARKYGIKAFYLLEELQEIERFLGERN